MLVSRLDRYVARHVLGAFFVVMLVVLGLMAISMLLDELGEVSSRYPFADALYFVLLSLPSMAYQLLPMSALVGTLIGLGMLASSSELTVMRASGLSMIRLLMTVIKPISLVAITALLMSEFLVPSAQQTAQAFKAERTGALSSNGNEQGAWYREQDRFIHVNAIALNGDLLGLVEHRFDSNHRLIETLSAHRAQYVDGAWLLQKVKQVRFSDGAKSLNIEESETLSWESQLTPELLSVILVEPMDLPVSGLSTYAAYLGEQGVNPKRYDLAFWNKTLQPFSVLALVLVGTAFIFGPLRSVTVGQRVLTGVIVGLVFKFSQDLLAPASQVLGFSAFWAAFVPIFISLLFATLMLARVR